ncbi:ATP-binding protein [bacterium]|nr:MAG: ATP-binding protein [bacterium]
MELVLMVGLPASGKSTFTRERFAETHEIVSKDAMRKGSNRVKKQRLALEAALSEGKSVVLDNTSVSREERAAAIEVAKAYGARVVVYRFDESVEACRTRNALREGAANVPLVAIYSAAKRYQEPSLEEGIDRIHGVKLGPEGFTIGS